jgi:hypothetical protein
LIDLVSRLCLEKNGSIGRDATAYGTVLHRIKNVPSRRPHLAFPLARNRRESNQHVMKTFIRAAVSLGSGGWPLVSHRPTTKIIGKVTTAMRPFRTAPTIRVEFFGFEVNRWRSSVRA